MGTSLNPDINVAKYKTETIGGVVEMKKIKKNKELEEASGAIIRSSVFSLILAVIIGFLQY